MEVMIKEIINSPIAAFHNEGLLVFALLQKMKTDTECITLSFEGITKCSTQFLNACIGKMYMDYGSEVEKFIQFNFGGLEILSHKIEEVKQNALHPNEYSTFLSNAMA